MSSLKFSFVYLTCVKLQTLFKYFQVSLRFFSPTVTVIHIDVGYGKMMKKKIGEQMENWLEEEENLEMWHDSIPAKTKKVLMAKWAGAAWRKQHSDNHFVKKLFEKTGCLMTANGDDDEKIRPQGPEPYTF